MLNSKFDAWCNVATAKIRYWGDRDAVSAELRAHLEDRYDALVEAGFSQTEATAKALEAMGDAKEIAPQLGKIHRPWLGWTLSIVRLIGITALVWAVIIGFYTGTNGLRILTELVDPPESLLSVVCSADDVDFYDTPNVRTGIGGYRLQVTEVARIPYDSVHKRPMLYVSLEVSKWPWLPDFNAADFIWLADSAGNRYKEWISNDREGPRIIMIANNGGYLNQRYTLVIADFDCSAEWIEFRYDRDGRNMVLRIDLTGGGQE